MLLRRLLVLPFFVQLEIRVELQSEDCRYDVDCCEDVDVQSAIGATRVSAFLEVVLKL